MAARVLGGERRLVSLPPQPEPRWWRVNIACACVDYVWLGLPAQKPHRPASASGGPGSLRRKPWALRGRHREGGVAPPGERQCCRHIHARSVGQRDRIFCCLINFVKRWS